MISSIFRKRIAHALKRAVRATGMPVLVFGTAVVAGVSLAEYLGAYQSVDIAQKAHIALGYANEWLSVMLTVVSKQNRS